MTGRLESVNVGLPRPVSWRGHTIQTAIWKSPVLGPVAVQATNVEGDRQGDPRVHGGPDKAVYAYATIDYDWWEGELGRSLDPGTFGENLTVSGLDLVDAVVGERWRIGEVLLEVTQPRIPCFKLGLRMQDGGFPRRFAHAGRPGTYLRVLQEGRLRAGDPVEVVHRPDHGVTVGLIERAYHRGGADGAGGPSRDIARGLARRLLAVDELPIGWREWAEEVLAAATADQRSGGRSAGSLAHGDSA